MKDRLLDLLSTVLKKYLSLINPRNDYGISDNRRRGLLRLLMGIASVSASFLICRFLGGTARGFSILTTPANYKDEICAWLSVISGAIWLAGIAPPLSLLILIVVGSIELILDKRWDDAEKYRVASLVLVGLPLAILILVYDFQFTAFFTREVPASILY